MDVFDPERDLDPYAPSDPAYQSARTLADYVFELSLAELARLYERTIADYVANGLPPVSELTIAALSRAASLYLRMTSEEMLQHYERTFLDGLPETRSSLPAIRTHLARDVCARMDRLVATLQEKVESYEEGQGRGRVPALDQELEQVKALVRERVDALVAQLG